jgi:hypothetical protein
MDPSLQIQCVLYNISAINSRQLTPFLLILKVTPPASTFALFSLQCCFPSIAERVDQCAQSIAGQLLLLTLAAASHVGGECHVDLERACGV